MHSNLRAPVLRQILKGLKIAGIMTFYFAVFVVIILAIIGADLAISHEL